MKMKCPYCNNEDTRVIDSRPAEDGSSIRRRRSCDTCGKRFTTYEKVETIPLIIIKKDNNREQYDRGKIENGILRACYKRRFQRQISRRPSNLWRQKSSAQKEKEVPSHVIGEIVMDALKGLDEVAYVRFASVYREFKDVNTFMEELGKLLKKQENNMLKHFYPKQKLIISSTAQTVFVNRRMFKWFTQLLCSILLFVICIQL